MQARNESTWILWGDRCVTSFGATGELLERIELPSLVGAVAVRSGEVLVSTMTDELFRLDEAASAALIGRGFVCGSAPRGIWTTARNGTRGDFSLWNSDDGAMCRVATISVSAAEWGQPRVCAGGTDAKSILPVANGLLVVEHQGGGSRLAQRRRCEAVACALLIADDDVAVLDADGNASILRL
jgi:hypothetical protein